MKHQDTFQTFSHHDQFQFKIDDDVYLFTEIWILRDFLLHKLRDENVQMTEHKPDIRHVF